MADDTNLEHWLSDLSNRQPYLDRETLVRIIEERVTQLLDTQPDLLWSYLYRLDVADHKIDLALKNGALVAHALATLIVERHILRLKTKRDHQQEPGQDFNFNPSDL